MFENIKEYCADRTREFDEISPGRKALLEKIADYIAGAKKNGLPVNLVYICTHNSRRSHFGQVWAKVASEFYGVKDVSTFSGGTEATAFNINAINALVRIGFMISPDNAENNPIYNVVYDQSKVPLRCFSKTYDHPENPRRHFAAITTCSEAEQNCPFIPGADLRISTTYEDPKAADNTPRQDERYDERCRQIARETLYVFSRVK